MILKEKTLIKLTGGYFLIFLVIYQKFTLRQGKEEEIGKGTNFQL